MDLLMDETYQTPNLDCQNVIFTLQLLSVRHHSGGSMKLNSRILLLAHMVYL
jgi:hypothetical protein